MKKAAAPGGAAGDAWVVKLAVLHFFVNAESKEKVKECAAAQQQA